MKEKSVFTAVFALGLAVVLWVGWGFVGNGWLALGITLAIAAVYLLGSWELLQFRAATQELTRALARLGDGSSSGSGGGRGAPQAPHAEPGTAAAPLDWEGWLQQLPAPLRHPVRQRVAGERVALPAPALTPYLVGLLVMLGMLGTFLGMVVTFQGAVAALQASANLDAIRAALAEPIKGLSLSFGTSVAGVAASAMLGLMAAVSRRQRAAAVRQLDVHTRGALRPFSGAQQRQSTLAALQAQADSLPRIAERLDQVMQSIEQRHEALSGELRAQQQAFHDTAGQAYTQLASRVGQSLHDSLGASARVAGELLQPAMAQALEALAHESAQAQTRLQASTAAQMEDLHQQWAGSVQLVASTWQGALQQQNTTHADLQARMEGAVAAMGQALEQRTQAVFEALQQHQQSAHAQQAQGDAERLAAWTQALEGAANGLSAGWQQAGVQALAQQQGVVQALARTSEQLDQHWQAAAQALEQRTQGAVQALEQQAQATATALAQQLRVAAQDLEQRTLSAAHDMEQRTQAVLAALQATAVGAQAAQQQADAQRVAQWSERMETMSGQLSAQWQQLGSESLAQQQAVCQALEQAASNITERMAAQVGSTLDGAAQLLVQSDALVRTRIATEAQWVLDQGARMDALSGVWRQEMQALRDAEAARGDAAVARLDGLQAAVGEHLATLGTALEAPLARLLQTAADVPQAAASVIAQLSSEMTQLSERDHLALQERSALTTQLAGLLTTVQDAAGQQRAAIDALVTSAGQVLAQAGEKLGAQVGAQTSQVDAAAVQVAASAVELTSLGDAFAHGMALFSDSNQQLTAQLQRMEGALAESLQRSDDQLAYYVAQAREVIDLSISAQQGIVEDLRRLHARSAAGVTGVNG